VQHEGSAQLQIDWGGATEKIDGKGDLEDERTKRSGAKGSLREGKTLRVRRHTKNRKGGRNQTFSKLRNT